MELGARDEPNAFTPERGAQALDYWRDTAQQILSDSEALSSTYALNSYSHNTAAATNLLAAHGFTAEADPRQLEKMLITVGWQMVRIGVSGICEAGRNTQGLKLINLEEPDKLRTIAPVISEGDQTAAENPPAT